MPQENVELVMSLYRAKIGATAWRRSTAATTGSEDDRVHGAHAGGRRGLWRRWIEQRDRGRGSGSRGRLHYFQATTVRNGKVTASHMAETKADALEAVGSPE